MVDKILDKASELFMNIGFKVVTMDDIASSMGISKKTIYQHYENKNILVEKCAEKIASKILEEIDQIYFEKNNPIEELLLIRDRFAHFFSDEKKAGIQQLKKYYPEIHFKLKNKQQVKVQSCIYSNIERGINLELYRNDLDIDFIVKLHHNAMAYIMDNDDYNTTGKNFIKYQNEYLEYHIRAIGTLKGIELLKNLKLKYKLHEE